VFDEKRRPQSGTLAGLRVHLGKKERAAARVSTLVSQRDAPDKRSERGASLWLGNPATSNAAETTRATVITLLLMMPRR
jgi:hypothetical protein